MKEEQDDLTLVYMFGYKNGKDSMKAENERLRAALAQANRTLAAAFNRIHCLPRTTDTALATEIGKTRAAICAALEGEKKNG